MWKCRSSYGDKCCSLCESRITEAAFENKVLYMRFDNGFVLRHKTWANPFKDKAYRSDASLVAMTVDDRQVSIPQDAIQVVIHGKSWLFGKEIGQYAESVSIDLLLESIKAYPEQYEILDVYSSENGTKMLFQGIIHDVWSGGLISKQDTEFEIAVQLREGTQMRYFWNELDMKKPV